MDVSRSLSPRKFISSVRDSDPAPPLRVPFLLSWCGMRGAISIAAALKISTESGIETESKQVAVYLAFCLVSFTLIFQGLSLPLILTLLGFKEEHHKEKTKHAKDREDAILSIGKLSSDSESSLESIPVERNALSDLLHQKKITTDTFISLERALDFKEASLQIRKQPKV